jgi:glyoxylase-like metal-dependent hydrolase (beta-lactamase superfamily II)
VHLIPIPAASTGSDLVIFLEKRALLFAGPLFYNHMQPVLRAGPGLKPCEWVRTLEELLARFQPRHVVPAEGDLGTEEDVREFIAYLKALSDPEVEFSYCRSNFDWPEIPGTTSLEENFDLVRGEKSHTTFG